MTDRSGKLRAEIIARTSLAPSVRDAMWSLFARYYADVTREKFDEDLDRKHEVILVRDSGDRSVQGFSTLEVFDRSVGDRRFVAIFSGDTVVDEAYWGQLALQRAFFFFIMRTKLLNPFHPVYWYLISKGYKTYLLMSRSFVNYYPRHDQPTPELERGILDHLSREKFGSAYDAARGVLRFDRCQGRLKDGIAPIDTSLLAHDDIRFFVHHNPGHARGDELCCLGKIDVTLCASYSEKLITKVLSRFLAKARRLWAVTTASF